MLRLGPSDDAKLTDMQMAVYIANHSSINSMDHLSTILKKLGKGSSLEKLKLKRTKCSSIITKVIAPSLLEQLVNDVADQPYSIIVDESTDVSCEKLMAYCIRYFSFSKHEIITDFLGFQVVERATAEQLCTNFLEFLNEVNLKVKNLSAIATDGANSLCGVNNSLYSRLKETNPSLMLFKCICHSLNKCAEKAGAELPCNIEFLLRETRNWFSHSALRKVNYESLYKSLNSGLNPRKLTQISATRWLVFHQAVKRTVEQWNELKTHFNDIAISNDREVNNSFTARTLANMLNDNCNLFYLHFLNSILREVNELNLSFQSDHADVSPLYDDLLNFISTVSRRIFKPSYLHAVVQQNASVIQVNEAKIRAVKYAINNADLEIGNSMLAPDAFDLGTSFQEFEASNHGIAADILTNVKKRCGAFLLKLCKELINRMPDNLTTMQKLRYFTPAVCLSNENIMFKDLPWELAPKGAAKHEIESEWRQLRGMSVKELFPNHITDSCPWSSTPQFWSKVGEIKNAVGKPIFEKLSNFALIANSVPISNAFVERIFSIMSIIKTKIRNRMGFQMLNSIVRVRTSVKHFTCCENFVPTNRMFQRFNSKTMYPTKLDNESLEQKQARKTVEGAEAAEFIAAASILNEINEDDY